MKTRLFITLMAIAVATVGFNAFAFHSGGVAECEGCHSMHEPSSPAFLLKGADDSSTCLQPTCHDNTTDTVPSSYHVSTSNVTRSSANPTGKLPVQRTPGGDFGWLKVSYSWSGGSESGASHGHNIIAAGPGYTIDPELGTAPGGSFPATALSCQSCHDPHGKGRKLSDGTFAATGAPIIGSGSYNNSVIPAAGQAVGLYRILWGAVGDHKPAGANFTSYPVAIAPATYNRTEATTQTRVAYGAGGTANSWGNWCGACHGDFNTTMKNLKHPVDVPLGSGNIADNYNAYVSSGIMTGTSTNSYLSLVPFAETSQDTFTATALKAHAKIDNLYLVGPANTDTVTCLSCHRAHASGFGEMLRFYYSYEFMTKNGLYVGMDNPAVGTTGRGPIQASGRNQDDFAAAYYDRAPSFTGPYNRLLCNKCHAQD